MVDGRQIAALWWVFVAVGVVFLGGSAGFYVHQLLRGDHGPLLRFPIALAVSQDEDIFVYTDFGRIRVFDAKGRFLRSWSVRASGGAATLRFNDEDQLEVATFRKGILYKFDERGALISAEENPSAFERVPFSERSRSVLPSGAVFALRGTSIVRIDPDGESETVVPGAPLYLPPPFRGEIPPFMFAVQGGLSLVVGLALLGAEQRGEPPAA